MANESDKELIWCRLPSGAECTLIQPPYDKWTTEYPKILATFRKFLKANSEEIKNIKKDSKNRAKIKKYGGFDFL